jgi:regulator of replication initiation timing
MNHIEVTKQRIIELESKVEELKELLGKFSKKNGELFEENKALKGQISIKNIEGSYDVDIPGVRERFMQD